MTPEFAAANAGYCPALPDGEWHRVAVPLADLRGGKALRACLKKGGCQRKLALISDEPTELTMKFEPTHVGCYDEKGIFRQALRQNISCQDRPHCAKWLIIYAFWGGLGVAFMLLKAAAPTAAGRDIKLLLFL